MSVYLVKEINDKGRVIREALYMDLFKARVDVLKIAYFRCNGDYKEYVNQFSKSDLGSIPGVVELSAVSFEDGYYNPQNSQVVWQLVDDNRNEAFWFVNFEKALRFAKENLVNNLRPSIAELAILELRNFHYVEDDEVSISLHKMTIEE